LEGLKYELELVIYFASATSPSEECPTCCCECVYMVCYLMWTANISHCCSI